MRRNFVVAIFVIATFFTAAFIVATRPATAWLFPGSVSQKPADQDKRLEYLPGKLADAVKYLREHDFRTDVSSVSEKDKGNGFTECSVGVTGDAGYPYGDGYSDCNHINYYHLHYKRVVKDKSPNVVSKPDSDVEKAVNSLHSALSKEVEPLIESGYVATKARYPGVFNTTTELTLVRANAVELPSGKTKVVIETIGIEYSNYDHCRPHREPGDDFPPPREPRN